MPVFGATCGNDVAEGNEQCDGTDVRGYTCPTLCYLDTSNPQDYNANLPYDGQYTCFDYGQATCRSDCTFSSTACHGPMCGDGILQGLEECDDGEFNSDTEADACRTDCTLPGCGDGVIDSNEDCDDASYNSDQVPDACRTNCQYAHCGDGVLDPYWDEECDDGNNDDYDGCYQCMDCYPVADNVHISQDAKLCPGTYTIADEGEEGVLIVDGYDMTLDCNGAQLVGVESEFAQAAAGQTGNQQAMQFDITQEESNTQGNTQQYGQQYAQEEESTGFFGGIFAAIVNVFTGEEEEEQSPPAGQSASTMKVGTGIYVTGQNVVLVGCDVTNYRNGIKAGSSQNALVNNRACGNTHDIYEAGSNYGAMNTCDNDINWQDGGFAGCTNTCGGETHEPTDCEECVCEECPVCEEPVEETPEETVEEEQPVEEEVVEEEPVEEEEETTETPVVEETVVEEEEETTVDEECIERYLKLGYSEEKAQAECEEEAADSAADEAELKECMEKYMEELGYTEEEAKTVCTGGTLEEETTDEKEDPTGAAEETEEEGYTVNTNIEPLKLNYVR